MSVYGQAVSEFGHLFLFLKVKKINFSKLH